MRHPLVLLTSAFYGLYCLAGIVVSLIFTDGSWGAPSRPLAAVILLRLWPFPMLEALRVRPDAIGTWIAAYAGGLACVAWWAWILEAFVKPEHRWSTKAATVALIGAFFALMILQIAAILTFRRE